MMLSVCYICSFDLFESGFGDVCKIIVNVYYWRDRDREKERERKR